MNEVWLSIGCLPRTRSACCRFAAIARPWRRVRGVVRSTVSCDALHAQQVRITMRRHRILSPACFYDVGRIYIYDASTDTSHLVETSHQLLLYCCSIYIPGTISLLAPIRTICDAHHVISTPTISDCSSSPRDRCWMGLHRNGCTEMAIDYRRQDLLKQKETLAETEGTIG